MDTLISIANTKGYKKLVERFSAFKSSLDWAYVPPEIRKAAASEVDKLIKFAHENDPLEPDYSIEELQAMMEQAQEAQKEEWESMGPVERFDWNLKAKVDETKRNIEEKIKKYLAKLGD